MGWQEDVRAIAELQRKREERDLERDRGNQRDEPREEQGETEK